MKGFITRMCVFLRQARLVRGRVTWYIAAAGLMSLITLTTLVRCSLQPGDTHTDTEAWITFKTPPENVIRQRVILYKDEVKIIRPGIIQAVVDYKQEALVLQYDKPLRRYELLLCHVFYFPSGMFGTRQYAKHAIEHAGPAPGDEFTAIDIWKEVSLGLQSSGEDVSPESLSPVARDMCYGARTLRLREAEGNGESHQCTCTDKWDVISEKGLFERGLTKVATLYAGKIGAARYPT